MKTATDTPGDAPVVQTTTTRRILSAESQRNPEFWEYIEKLKPEEWDRHIVYIYRTDPRTSNYGDGQSCIDKCPGYIEIRPGQNIPFSDREEVELAIREKHGGRAFRLILKRGHERVTEGKSSNDAPPKFAQNPAAGSNGNSGPSVTPVGESSAIADVAKQGMHMLASREEQAVGVAVNALRGAADVVTRLSQAPAPSASDDLFRQAMIAMMQRMMAPPPDPLETLSRLLAVMRTVEGASNPASAANPTVTKILDTALDRMLNPMPSGPVSSAGAELVRQLPQVANYVGEAIREWRMGLEAQRDTAAMMTGKPAPAGAPSAQPGVIQPPARLPAAAPAINPSPTMTVPSLEFIETKIIEIFHEADFSADQAADETMVFLERMDPQLPAQLISLGEPGLLQLFNVRPILKPATQNLTRLQEFIKAFLKYGQENEQPPAGGAGPGLKPN